MVAPVNLGSATNTAANETRPSLSWDATTLYFGRIPGSESAASDIYVDPAREARRLSGRGRRNSAPPGPAGPALAAGPAARSAPAADGLVRPVGQRVLPLARRQVAPGDDTSVALAGLRIGCEAHAVAARREPEQVLAVWGERHDPAPCAPAAPPAERSRVEHVDRAVGVRVRERAAVRADRNPARSRNVGERLAQVEGADEPALTRQVAQQDARVLAAL
jgi:hypothetical protein